MSKFVIEFSTDNAAFEDDLSIEVYNILDEISISVSHGWRSGRIKDVNGNTIGGWTHIEGDE